MGSGSAEVDIELCREIASMCVCLNLRKASRAVTQAFDDMLQPVGVRATQLPFLVTLCLIGPATITRLSEELVMDRTSVTRHIELLTKRGLVRTERGRDRRTRNVDVTALGEQLVATAQPLWVLAQTRVVRDFGRQRWSRMRADLQAVVGSAQKE